MSIFRSGQFRLGVALAALASTIIGCSASASNSPYFGKTDPPPGQILRYVSGSEIESLDPQVGTGQPEARIYMSLFEGLTEFHPQTMEPIPAIAERWEVNSDSSEFVFHLRKNARWSNGDPITAHDFVYSFRRGLSPKLAARYAYIAYYIKYAQPYNEGGVFVRDKQTGEFLPQKEASAATSSEGEPPPAEKVQEPPPIATEYPANAEHVDPDTPFHGTMHAPMRLVLPGDEKDRAAALEKYPKLKAAVAGKNVEFVPVQAEDIGVEAVDDHTFRVSLIQPAPFFVGMMSMAYFRVVPQKAIEKYGETAWTQPGNMVSSGAFKLKAWKPYNELVVVRNPMYWDAANVRLDQISFYPLEENSTIMRLYKAGEIEGCLNHTVPNSWIDVIRTKKDYMDAPEAGNDYYQINTTKPPMTDVRVRKAFNMALDKAAYAQWRKIVKPLTGFVPEGIFKGYPNARGDQFDPARAKQLLAEAGFKDGKGNYDPKKFPINEVELTYNTTENNRAVAEFLQAQWKQNLGITVPLKSMEFRTFLQVRAKGDYKGIARDAWGGDYMDPFTFLNLFYVGAENGSGWHDPKYDAMLDAANRETDPQKRYELFAKAEAYMLEEQPVIPLDTPTVNWMKKPYIKGMYPNPLTLHPWKFVYIEYDQAKWDQGTPNLAE